jgi:TPP-dependent 2-oxoacid decarboxylase
MDKATLDETHPNYIGIYDGRLADESVPSSKGPTASSASAR